MCCWQVLRTALSQLVNKLAANLLQTQLVDKLLERHCHNLLTSLLQACRGDILLTSCWNSIVKTCWQAFCKLTHVKISHLVASLPTSRQQVVFALLVPSCQQVWNKLLTTCDRLVGIIRLAVIGDTVASILALHCYNINLVLVEHY